MTHTVLLMDISFNCNALLHCNLTVSPCLNIGIQMWPIINTKLIFSSQSMLYQTNSKSCFYLPMAILALLLQNMEYPILLVNCIQYNTVSYIANGFRNSQQYKCLFVLLLCFFPFVLLWVMSSHREAVTITIFLEHMALRYPEQASRDSQMHLALQ